MRNEEIKMTEKYFKELTRILAMNDIGAAPPDRNSIPEPGGGFAPVQEGKPQGTCFLRPEETPDGCGFAKAHGRLQHRQGMVIDPG